MKKEKSLLVIVFVLAFCSLVYELILAQTLSVFLGNTILRYSTTIGLYLFFMGVGSVFTDKVKTNRLEWLINAEMILAVIGGCSVVVMYLLDYFIISGVAFTVIGYTLVAIIGFLTGMELPIILKEAKNKHFSEENTIIAINASGSAVGTLVFAFVFYVQFGLLASSMITALINVFAAFLLFLNLQKTQMTNSQKRAILLVQVLVAVFFLTGLWFLSDIENLMFAIYTNKA